MPLFPLFVVCSWHLSQLWHIESVSVAWQKGNEDKSSFSLCSSEKGSPESLAWPKDVVLLQSLEILHSVSGSRGKEKWIAKGNNGSPADCSCRIWDAWGTDKVCSGKLVGRKTVEREWEIQISTICGEQTWRGEFYLITLDCVHFVCCLKADFSDFYSDVVLWAGGEILW